MAGRDAAFEVFVIAPMAGPLVEVAPAITQAVADGVVEWSTGGSLLNHLGQAGPERVRRVWPAATRERLLAVKRRIDRTDLFSTGHAIGL